MAEKNDQERTEEPTAHKVEKAREEGNVAKSTEIASVMLLVVSTAVLMNFGGWMYDRLESMFRTFFVASGSGITTRDSALDLLKTATWYGFEIIAPLLIGLFVMAILAHMVQTGVVFAPKILEMKPDRLSPQKGLKKIFSMRGVVELVKGFGKIFLVGMIVFFTVRSEIENFSSFMVLPLDEILVRSGQYILLITTRILTALVILSIMDAAYSRFQHRKDLRMTKQEVKDEYKQMEGDPQMKGKRKQMAMKFMQQKRLDHAVLASEVVVTNPTHYAVAIKYDPKQNDAPMIMAKGMRKRALKIREYAKKYEVPIVENPPVARALYASANENELIPAELYQAVAEILAYVYKIKEKSNVV